MKKDKILETFWARKPIIHAVYIGHEKEIKRNEAPSRNQKSETFISKHTILYGSKTYELTEFKESKEELDKTTRLLPEFTPVVVTFTSMEETDWGNRIKGTIHTIEA